jgi:methylthioribose-1-phosphate isomerase
MVVRGAPLIGATAAYGLALAARDDASEAGLARARDLLLSTRPTAVDLRNAVTSQTRVLCAAASGERARLAYRLAAELCDADAAACQAIGQHGLGLLRQLHAARGGDGPLRILTHCNAGWLATVDFGTALSPVYAAHEAGLPVHVWVDETRPRNQGSQLTAWELAANSVAHTLIVDNAGGYLMQRGDVDIVITGTDRTTRCGDVANKIGTYLKALAASDNNIPFYVALPSTTIDWSCRDGLEEIPIEQRDPVEVSDVYGLHNGRAMSVRTTAANTPISNFAFDVTPARLVTGFITERGICEASEFGLLGLFPERGAR